MSAAYLSSAKLRNVANRLFNLERRRHLSTLPSTSELSQDDIRKKIIYNSKQLEDNRWRKFLTLRKFVKENKAKAKLRQLALKEPIAMKFLADVPAEEKEMVDEQSVPEEKENKPTVMPLALKVVSTEVIKCPDTSVDEVPTYEYSKQFVDGSTVSTRKVWSNDYVNVTHKLDDETKTHDHEWILKYGTSNVQIPSSSVPCGGCGGLLHCKDPSIPGFIPQEVFVKKKPTELRSITCQRCYFLQNHNTSLSVAVDSKIYPQIIANIKSKNALVLLAIDLTDFPCSIWPGITDLVGLSCPLFLVGNKVDLLWGDSRGWMTHVEKTLRSFFPRKANIIGTHLISAKTGFGVEELISKLHSSWRTHGDVYLVGCTNVGKSTLFNALLQSDYCKVKAADLVQRATTAPWPGTTLNLLKFPIMRPEGWRLYLRSRRLQMERTARVESALRKQQIRDEKKQGFVAPQLIGHIGRTFHEVEDTKDPFEQPNFTGLNNAIPGSGLNPEDPDFKKGRWFFDTPGVLHDDQILDLLTTDELVKVLPQKSIEPRTLIMKPGWTLFVGGIARVDFLSASSSSINWTVFVSREIPLTVCFTEDAEQVYKQLSGTELFSVPSGDADRLSKWPPLEHKGDYKFSGFGKKKCCGDIVLSSCGWISFAPDKKEIISVRPWTPNGRGIYPRSPALLPFAVQLKGVLMKGSPAFSRPRSIPSAFYDTIEDEVTVTGRSKKS